jgi:hypothetical protein
MKKDFTLFMELKNLATGLGWDETNLTIACSNTQWTEHLAVREVFHEVFQFLLHVYFPLPGHFFQRCNNPERGVKCGHVKFQNHGPSILMIYTFSLIRCISPGQPRHVWEMFLPVNQVMMMFRRWMN